MNWIAGAINHPGALHKTLHIKSGQKIPASKLRAATHSKDLKTRRRAILAMTLRGFHH